MFAKHENKHKTWDPQHSEKELEKLINFLHNACGQGGKSVQMYKIVQKF